MMMQAIEECRLQRVRARKPITIKKFRKDRAAGGP
jgi:hypothetical protein